MADENVRWIRRTPAGGNLVLFAHGFTGDYVGTWGAFPELLEKDPELSGYDVCFWGYPSSLNPLYQLIKRIWTDNPDIDTLGRGLGTMIDNAARGYDRLVLVGHSMGGLVIQLMVLHEALQGHTGILGRLTEIVLYGTPSAGLVKANLAKLLNTQIADMSAFSGFVSDLRAGWRKRFDEGRTDDVPPFRLTLVAGMKDQFVPQQSSLDPFPLDEKEIVPGDHASMVKPGTAGDLAFLVLKRRLLRGSPSQAEREVVMGRSPQVVERIARARAAADLGDVDDLAEQAAELLAAPPALPLVERALGLALLDHEAYREAAELLSRYVELKLPGEEGRAPFRADAQALQQLAIALSGAGRLAEAVARLQQLPPELRDDPETKGILAGRFKRQWLKTQTNPQVGFRAYDLYCTAFETAKSAGQADQVVYNGVNAAYLGFALGEPGYKEVAEETLAAASGQEDYWSTATRAECLLLLGRHEEALAAYRDARRRARAPRHWTSTGQQALDILARQGNPPDGTAIQELFRQVRPDFG